MNPDLPPGTLLSDLEPEVAEDGRCTRCGDLLMADENGLCAKCCEKLEKEENEKDQEASAEK